jgi:hypothetical protein
VLDLGARVDDSGVTEKSVSRGGVRSLAVSIETSRERPVRVLRAVRS